MAGLLEVVKVFVDLHGRVRCISGCILGTLHKIFNQSNQTSVNAFTHFVNTPLTSIRPRLAAMSSRDTASTDSLKQKSLKSFFSKAPAVGSKTPKTPAPKPLQKSVTSVSSASNAKYKSNIPHSSSEIDPPKTPESSLTDLRALNSSAAGSTRSVAWSNRAGSTPPTSDPIPIEQDEDEDVVMLSSDKSHVTSIKTVRIFIIKSVKREKC